MKIKQVVAFLNASVLLLSAIACNMNHNKNIDDGLSSLVKVIGESQLRDKDALKGEAQLLIKSQKSNFVKLEKNERLVGVFDNRDTDKAVSWIKNNEKTISSVVGRMKAGIEKEITDINSFSKNAYLEKNEESRSYQYARRFPHSSGNHNLNHFALSN